MISHHPKKYLMEIMSYKNLLFSLVSREIYGKYKNSKIGFGWNVASPIIILLTYCIIFSVLKTADVDNLWIYITTALFPFYFMINNFSNGTMCIVNNSNMVKKMYFPREIIVISHIISTGLIFLINYCIALAVIVISGHLITWHIILLPLAMLAMVSFTYGYTLIFSSINVYIRDLGYLIQSISFLFYFITPIYFTVENNSLLYWITMLNPFSYYIDLFRDLIYWNIMPDITTTIVIAIISIITPIFGTIIFKHLKKGFAERL